MLLNFLTQCIYIHCWVSYTPCSLNPGQVKKRFLEFKEVLFSQSIDASSHMFVQGASCAEFSFSSANVRHGQLYFDLFQRKRYLQKLFSFICSFIISMILASLGSFLKREERLNFTRVEKNRNLLASNMILNSAKFHWSTLSCMVKYYWPWQFNSECILTESDLIFFY